MNCQEALNLLYDFIDKEASEIDARQVEEHLHNCRHCFEKYKIEGTVDQLIKEKLTHAEATPCTEALKSKILGRLDEIDAGQKKIGRSLPLGKTALTFAAAAVLVLAIGAALVVASFYRHHDLFIPLEEAHWNGAKAMATFANTDLTSATEARLTGMMHYRVQPQVGSFALVGGHMESVDGVEMAHFIYRNEDHQVSVFVAPAGQFTIPETLSKTAVSRNELTLFDHNCRGCRLVYHRAGDAIVVTATADRDVDLLDFIPGSSTAAGSI